MKEIKWTTEIKEDGEWIVDFECKNELEIYKSLSRVLIAKKINGTKDIKSIKRESNYDGTVDIIVGYGSKMRRIYTVVE